MDNKTLVPVDPFQEMERADEQMVLDEIKGRAMDALVYQIEQRGQTITGLSLAGIRETARSMNARELARIGISDKEPTIIETDDYFEVKVYAQDLKNGGGYWGIKRQSKKYGNGSVNQFALEQALAKAQRNALRGLIPEYFVKAMIDAWLLQGKTKSLTAATKRHPQVIEHEPGQSPTTTELKTQQSKPESATNEAPGGNGHESELGTDWPTPFLNKVVVKYKLTGGVKEARNRLALSSVIKPDLLDKSAEDVIWHWLDVYETERKSAEPKAAAQKADTDYIAKMK